VAKTFVAADLNLAADVCSNLTAKVTLKLEVAFEEVTKRNELGVAEVLHANVWGDARSSKCLLGTGTAYTVDVSESYHYALIAREVHSNQTCHY
jgi:hypothetical protein